MKILIVVPLYVPAISPRAFRWSSIAEHWAATGHHVVVVAAWAPSLDRIEERRSVRIVRVGSRIVGVPSVPLANRETPVEKRRGTWLGSWLHRGARILNQLVWRRLYWPDYACLWYWPAKKAVNEILSAERYDALISVSLPFTAHLVGLWAKQKFPNLRWIADTGDPFSFHEATPTNNHALFARLNGACEERVTRHADSISVTTKSIVGMYQHAFPSGAAKFRVIPPVLFRANARASDAARLGTSLSIKVVYVGIFYRKLREPGPFVDLFDQLAQRQSRAVEVHVFGEPTLLREALAPAVNAKKLFHLHGVVSRETIERVLEEADVLVNVGNVSSYQLPSKIVEYTATGKPILNIASVANDTSLELLADYPLALNLVIEQRARSNQVAALGRFLEGADRRRLSAADIAAFVKPYEVSTVSQSYLALMDGEQTPIHGTVVEEMERH